MGKLLQDYEYNQYQSQYVPIPDSIGQTGLAIQQQADTNRANESSLLNELIKVPTLPIDAPKKQAIINKYQSDVDDMLKRSGGRWSQLDGLIQQHARKLTEDMSTGPLSTYNQQYVKYQQAQKEFEEASKAGNFAGMDDIAKYNKLIAPLNDYNNNGGVTHVHGGSPSNPFTPGTMGKYADMEKEMSEFAKGWKPDTVKLGWTKGLDGNYYDVQSKESVSPKEVHDAMLSDITANPKYSGQIKDMLRYYHANGQDPVKSVNGVLEGILNPIAQREGYTKVEDKYLEDPQARARGEKMDNAFTTWFRGGASDVSIDPKVLDKAKVQYQGNLDDINKKMHELVEDGHAPTVVKSGEDKVTAYAALYKQRQDVEHKLRLQDELKHSLEGQANWDWDKEYNALSPEDKNKFSDVQDFKNSVNNTEAIRNQETTVLDEASKKFPLWKPTHDKGVINPEYDRLNKEAERVSGKAYTSEQVKDRRDKSIQKASEGGYHQDHDIILGNDKTYVGQYDNMLKKAISEGSISMTLENGTQLDPKSITDKEIKDSHILPTKGFIAGRPGMAFTIEDKNGKKSTVYGTLDEANGIADYSGMGRDLIDQANHSSFAKDPKKRDQLLSQGYAMLGYSDIGQSMQEAKLYSMKGGDSREVPLQTGALTIDAHEVKGVKWYTAKLNGVPLRSPLQPTGKFSDEEDIMRSYGAVIHHDGN